MKQPETYDVYQLLKSKSANWEEFAIELKIKENDCKRFRKLITTSSENVILKDVLDLWIQSETSEVTWKHILNVLERLEYIDLLKIVQMYLRKEDVIKKYCKKDDYKVIGEILMKILYLLFCANIICLLTIYFI